MAGVRLRPVEGGADFLPVGRGLKLSAVPMADHACCSRDGVLEPAPGLDMLESAPGLGAFSLIAANGVRRSPTARAHDPARGSSEPRSECGQPLAEGLSSG